MPVPKKEMVYEVRDGSEVLGQFSSKGRAQSFKKACSAEGGRLKIVSRFISTNETVPEPKPVRPTPKATVPKPKAQPKPKAVPKPADKPKAVQVPKTEPEPVGKSVPKRMPKSDSAGFISGRLLKSLAKLFRSMENPLCPIDVASYNATSGSHVAMLCLSNRSGRSVFGLPDAGTSKMSVDIVELSEKCSVNSLYEVTVENDKLVLSDGRNAVRCPLVPSFKSSNIPVFYSLLKFTVDPQAFDTQLRRVSRVVRGVNSGGADVQLRGEHGDLMMRSQYEGYGMDVDIGDGDDGKGSLFQYAYIRMLADMFLMSDSPCTLMIDDLTPLDGRCTVGDLDLRLLIAPKFEEDY